MKYFLIGGFVGPWQIVLIILIVVLLFGGRKIPELMKGIGQGMTEFKKATKKEDDTDKNNNENTQTPDTTAK